MDVEFSLNFNKHHLDEHHRLSLVSVDIQPKESKVHTARQQDTVRDYNDNDNDNDTFE